MTPEERRALDAKVRGSAYQQNATKIAQQNQYDGKSAGAISGVRSLSSTWTDDSKLPAPKASAAPTGAQQYIYTGLCAALNKLEQDKVKKGTVEIANVYEVQFAPDTLKSELVTIPGATDQIATPMQSNQTAKDKSPDTNKMNTKARNIAVKAGTQVIQFIETVMRNSTYITKQQTRIQDQVTGNDKPSESTKTNNTTTWFKINTKAVPIGSKIDSKRNDFAYHITYTISTYQINQAESQYFPQAQFQGVHKVYDYWYTGQNTQVLNFEQNYKTAYFNSVSGVAPVNITIKPDLAAQVQYGVGPNKNVPSITSGQSDKGAQNGALNPASTLADYLYSQPDQASVSITIVGDPAWIQQGEVLGINAVNFNYQGFYPDGTVNTEAQQAVFVINWNAPADYNQGTSGPASGTGLMDISTSGATGTNPPSTTTPGVQTAPQAAQASAAYVAFEVKSTFSKGKFEQTLKGVLLKNLNAKQIADNTRLSSTAVNKTKEAASVSGTKPDVRQPTTANSRDGLASSILSGGSYNAETGTVGYATGA